MAKSPARRSVVVGVGGSGSYLADFFGRVLNACAPESQLILVDGDTFEPKNAERQNFTRYGNKARSVASDLQEKLDNIYVIPRAAWVVPEGSESPSDEESEGTEYITAESLLRDGDIVFVCVDNFGARKLLFDAAAKLDNVDIFHGGNESDGSGDTYYYCRRDGKDVTDHPGVHYDVFVNPPDKNPGELSCAERAMLEGGTQLIATNVSVAAHLCHDAQQAIFADLSSEGVPEEYHFAGVILASQKMWNLDDASSVAYARCSAEDLEHYSKINPDVAAQVHGYVMTFDDDVAVVPV